MSDEFVSPALRKWRERNASKVVAVQKPEPTTEYNDLIPDDEPSEFGPSDQARAVDYYFDRDGLFGVYDRIGKRRQQVKGRTENVMCQCPNPTHPDESPSAWAGLRDGKWHLYCGKCSEGWDAIKLAALVLDRPYDPRNAFEYKKEYVYKFHGYDYDYEVSKANAPAPLPVADDANASEPLEPVQSFHAENQSTHEPAGQNPVDIVEPANYEAPTYDIDAAAPPSDTSFLRQYYNVASTDDSPNEFHLFCAFVALSAAVGRRILLEDARPVTANMAICLTGPTSAGKSTALSYATDLVTRLFPDIKHIQNVGSGEALVRAHIQTDEVDVGGGVMAKINTPVVSIIEYPELSGLMSKGASTGSTLKPRIHDFCDSNKMRVENHALTSGDLVAVQPHANLVTTTQPGLYREILSDSDAASGFLNRVLFVDGNVKKRRAFGGKQLDFSVPGDLLRMVNTWSRSFTVDSPLYVTVTPEAYNAYEPIHERIHVLNSDRDNPKPLLGRLELTMKRLMLLFAIDDLSTELKAKHVHQAGALFDYLLACYGALETKMQGSQGRDDDLKIMRIIQFRNEKDPIKGITAAEIPRYIKGYDSQKLRSRIRSLIELGQLYEISKQSTGGRKRTMLYVTEGVL